MTEEEAKLLYGQYGKNADWQTAHPLKYSRMLEQLGLTGKQGEWANTTSELASQKAEEEAGKLKSYSKFLNASVPSYKMRKNAAKEFVGAEYIPGTGGRSLYNDIWNNRKGALTDVINAKKEQLAYKTQAQQAKAQTVADAYQRMLAGQELANNTALQQAQLTGYYTPPALSEMAAREKAYADAGEGASMGQVQDLINQYMNPSATPTLDMLSMMSKSSGSGSRGRSSGTSSAVSAGMLELARRYLDGDSSVDISNLSYDLQGEFWNAVASLGSTTNGTGAQPTVIEEQLDGSALQDVNSILGNVGNTLGNTTGGVLDWLSRIIYP